MMKMNAVFYLALMFSLGTCALVNMEPKMDKDEIFSARIILAKIIEKQRNDGIVENSASDTASQIYKLVTSAFRNDNLSCGGMKCYWKSKSGYCLLPIDNEPIFNISMIIDKSGVDYTMWMNHQAVAHMHMPDGSVGHFKLDIFDTVIELQIKERRIKGYQIEVCFKLIVTHSCYQFIINYGCSHNVYSVTEGKPVKGDIDWNSNLKNFMKFKDVYSDETDSSENALKWNEDV